MVLSFTTDPRGLTDSESMYRVRVYSPAFQLFIEYGKKKKNVSRRGRVRTEDG